MRLVYTAGMQQRACQYPCALQAPLAHVLVHAVKTAGSLSTHMCAETSLTLFSASALSLMLASAWLLVMPCSLPAQSTWT